ncbi:hypothetical protein PFISCL1PPCAC_5397, partial [Pristionchus fissidentatus]
SLELVNRRLYTFLNDPKECRQFHKYDTVGLAIGSLEEGGHFFHLIPDPNNNNSAVAIFGRAVMCRSTNVTQSTMGFHYWQRRDCYGILVESGGVYDRDPQWSANPSSLPLPVPSSLFSPLSRALNKFDFTTLSLYSVSI